jgi:hypothetical protein
MPHTMLACFLATPGTAFIGHVLRRGHAVDPDRAFDTAGELYLDWRDVAPEFAADSAFDPGSDASDSLPPRKSAVLPLC